MKALLLLLLALPAAAADHFLPRSNQVFRPLLADPRQVGLGASYYRLDGQNMADVALGHSWGMARWDVDRWQMQWNIEGMAYSRFQVSGDINKFQAVDFEGNASIETNNGIVDAKAYLYHISSHLGDDYIRDTGDTGFRYSVEGLRALIGSSPWSWMRVYGGGGYMFHRIPIQDRGSLQLGLEFRTPLYKAWGYPSLFYLAQDAQWRERVRWNPTSRTVLGWRISENEGRRAMRVHIGYQIGHSAFGQFYLRREKQADVGVTFEL